MFRRCAHAVLGTVAASVIAGCSAAAEPDVRAAAQEFAAALARHDGAPACALLTDDARRTTETFGRSCAAQLATLPGPGAAQAVELWSDAARVRFTGDTVFLLRFPDGWRVSAAACTARDDAPYECEVQG